MNDLNLRVAALKLCAHPKRFAELRDALVPLPKRWEAAAPQGFVQQFLTASSSAEQVLVVKDLYYKEQAEDELEHFLADLLLASPLKHAVRNQLTKLFSDNALAKQKVQRHTKDSLMAALRQSLREMAASLGQEGEAPRVSHDRLNDVFVSANACLQNFAFGREALGAEVHLYMPLLPMALERYWADISNPSLELSPTRRNELYFYVQNALRFQVSLLSEWSEQAPSHNWQPLFQATDAVAQSVARHVDTPWDVRSIAGLLIGHLARCSGRFGEYLQDCSRPQAERDLPVQTAALLVLQRTDYAEHAPQALAILRLILAVAQSEGNVSNLLVYLSKHLFIYSKSLGELPAGQEHVLKLILAELQGFALENISSAIDSVRHMSSSLFRQVLQHAQATGQEELCQVVYRQFEAGEAPLGASCLALEQLTGVLGVGKALSECPSLFGVVFPRFLGVEDSVDSLFRAMMISAHQTQPFGKWQALWFGQLLAATQVPDKRRPAIEQLLTQAVQLEPQALAQVLLQDARLPLSGKLAAILSVRQLGERRQELLRQLMPELERALLGLDDHTRLLALRFVVETPRLSEPLTPLEVEFMELYLRYNANNPSAHLRQLGYGLLQKALRRIHLGLAEHQKRPSQVGEELLGMLSHLMGLLARNLFPSANYGRRWLSLHLLRDCLELCRSLKLSGVEEQLPEVALGNLELCLGDSYEQNKLLAAQLLEKLQKRCRFQPERMLELLLSLRPPDSATGAYQLQVYCKAKEVEVELPVIKVGALGSHHEPRIFRALQWCLQHLREGLALAQQDLAEAAKLNPLYGLLLASRHLLQQLSLKELTRENCWRQYIQELVEICLEVSQVVLPVVSSASPEGHLPESQNQEQPEPLLANVFSRRLPSEALQQVRTTPQMVLLCAWRSIKEVSLILGELVQRAPLEEEQKEDYLLASSQLEAIGELFLLLLAETKHRGAFEQAYVGFSLLCRRLWHSDAVRLNQLPAQWVSEAMAMVSGEPEQRLCSTRRSAGMPFMLQALICSELKLGTHATLHRCMQRLLEVCERRSPGQAGITARSHALNILRALFRCSELAELVTEFVARGIQCALESLLQAEEWAERNCATLLLAALVVRVFGVERARLDTGELHVRNRMTGRIFFTRYPQLFDYFHAGLQREAEEMETGEGSGARGGAGGSRKRRQALQLEAMLLMLSRLYPSSLEGAESSLNLSEFVPFLLRICRSHDLMTRERAALVVANFVSQERALAEIRRITVELKALQLRLEDHAFPIPANHWHGQLLLLLHLHRLTRWMRPSLARMQLHTLASLAAPLLRQDVCLFSALVEVMVAIMEDAQEPLVVDISAVYGLDHGEVYRRCQEQGISMRFYQIFCLHLHRLLGSSKGMVQQMVRDWTGTGLPAALDELKVELWLYLLLQRLKEKEDQELDLEHFQFASDIRRYQEALSPSQLKEVTRGVYESQEIRSCVLEMVMTPCWSLALASRLAALQPLLQEPGLHLKEVIARCSRQQTPSSQQPGLVLALKRLIRESGQLEPEHWLPLLDYALSLIQPVQPVYLRHQAVELCELLARSHLKEDTADVEVLGRFMRLVLLLLLDEAEWVRHRAAQLVASSGFRRELGQEQVEVEVKDRDILPSALIAPFLKLMLGNLQKRASDEAFLLRLFQLIAEPFLPSKDADLEATDLEVDVADVEVFDKQEINLYCESLLVLCELAQAMRAQFGASRELLAAIDALGLPADLVGS